MRKVHILVFVVSMLLSCSRPSGEKHSSSYPQIYAKLGIPDVHLSVKAGDTVLAPQKKFLSAFLSGRQNFFWFHPRLVDSVGEYSVWVWEIDSLVEVPKAFVITFPHHCEVKKGDYVLTWWQAGSGMQRAYVLGIVDSGNIVVRYLDLDVFTAADANNVIDTIKMGTFRTITGMWSAGAAVLRSSGSGKDFYVIINHRGDSLVCRSSIGKVEFFNKADVQPCGVVKDLRRGQDVEIPFYGIYIPGKIISFGQGYAQVRARIIDRVDTLSVPLLDVFVD